MEPFLKIFNTALRKNDKVIFTLPIIDIIKWFMFYSVSYIVADIRRDAKTVLCGAGIFVC